MGVLRLFLVVAGPLEITMLLTLSLGNIQGGKVENVFISALNRLHLLMDSHFLNKAFSFQFLWFCVICFVVV